MIDYFELAKDIVRAAHQRDGLPSPDGKAPSEFAQDVVAATGEFRNPPTNPATLIAKGIEL